MKQNQWKKIKTLRGIIEFKEYQITMNGKFYSFTAPIILDKNNKFMLHIMVDFGKEGFTQ